MNNKQKIFNLIILDESGSMEEIKTPIISGFNEIVQTIKGTADKFPEQEHTVSLISFNSLGIRIADSLSINNHLVFETNEADVKKMFAQERRGRERYYGDIYKEKKEGTGFFEEGE